MLILGCMIGCAMVFVASELFPEWSKGETYFWRV